MTRDRDSFEAIADAVPEVLYAVDPDGNVLWGNRTLRTVTGYSAREIEGMGVLDFVPPADESTVLSVIERVISERSVQRLESRLVTSAGATVPYEFTFGPLIDDGTAVGVAGVGRDVSDRQRPARRLERERTLQELSRSIDVDLAAATTRQEIERSVCDSVAAVARYRSAAFWARRGDDGGFERTAAAGEPVPTAGSVEIDDEAGPATRAVDTGTVVVAVGDDREVSTVVGADEHDVGPMLGGDDRPDEMVGGEDRPAEVAVVPVVIDERVFGVLGIAAGVGWSFSEREREILASLGTRIAGAVRAALTRQLLYADVVTQIEVETTDASSAFVALSRATGGRFELDHAIGFDDLILYERVTETAVDDVLEFVADDDRFAHAEHLNSDGGVDEMKFRIADGAGTLTSVLTRHGARTVAATAEAGRATLTAELPPDQDPRGVLDAVRERFPETDLVAIRESERADAIAAGVRRRIDEALTAKQRAALEAAVRAGYFEWPARGSSAEEIAATLGIASQTFHQHLRIAQQKLLAVVLDEGTSP